MSETSGDGAKDDHSQLAAAAILLSLKTTPPSFPKKFNSQSQNGNDVPGISLLAMVQGS